MARRETTPDDLPQPKLPSIDITETAQYMAEPIVQVDRPLETDYARALQFAEEMVTVRLEVPDTIGDEGLPVLAYPVTVNNKTEWLQPGVEKAIRRKYLAALLVAQPMRVSTEVIKEQGREFNLIHRSLSRRYPVTIVHDPNPKGAEWARRTAMQGG